MGWLSDYFEAALDSFRRRQKKKFEDILEKHGFQEFVIKGEKKIRVIYGNKLEMVKEKECEP